MQRDLLIPVWVAMLAGALALSACSGEGERGRGAGAEVPVPAVAQEASIQEDVAPPGDAEDQPTDPESGDSAPVVEMGPMIQGRDTGASGSGVEGTVTIDPICPVVDPDRPCAPRPYAARLVIREAASGDHVVQVESDSTGRFRVELPPGAYVLAPLGPVVLTEPTATPVRFTVEEGSYAKVELRFDSGVR